MNFIYSLFSRVLLALTLATGAGAAAAGPLYHVDLDLRSFSGLGSLDISFAPGGEYVPAKATLTNFSSGFLIGDQKWGTVTGSALEGQIVFDNSGSPELLQLASLGGHLGFDVRFDGLDDAVAGNPTYGTAFRIGLFDASGMTALVDQLLLINLYPGDMSVDASAYASFGPATPAAVPEPSAALLVMLGLLMATAVLRRRA